MAKRGNTSESATIRVTISRQSESLLEKLAGSGVYGRNVAEVAGRFVDEALQRFVEAPKFKLNLERRKRS